MKTNGIRLSLLIGASALLAGVFGCPGLMPGPESVLEGTWELVPSDGFDAPLTNCLLTFDSRGELTEVSYVFENQTTVTWREAPASASVDGDQVHISATQSGNGLNFYGTLNSTTEPTSADGTLSVDLVIGSFSTSVSQGAATLVRQ
jgi:hypothetical protein